MRERPAPRIACSRAQRLAASKHKSRRLRQEPDRGRRVLNGSRHHRKNRALEGLDHLIYPVCSTPRGITGKIAETRISPRLGLNCAQRLAASQEKSLDILV